MSDYLQKIVYLTENQYQILKNNKTAENPTTVNGQTQLMDNYIYLTNGKISNDDLDSDLIIPVTRGGTGATSWASGQVLIGNDTGSFNTRAITNNTTAQTAITANTNLVTANTIVNWLGSSNISTVGTITSGTWQGTKIANNYLANSSITIGTSSVSLGGTLSAITADSFSGNGSSLTNLTPTNITGVVSTTAKKFLKDTGSWTQVDWEDLTGKPATFTPSTHTHYELATIGDQRSTATTPNTYKNRFIFQGLKTNTVINSPYTDTYSYLIGLRGWTDNTGGDAHEFAFNGNGVYRRQGQTAEWGNWLHLLDSGNTTAPLSIPTLSWNTESTVFTLNGTAVKIKAMAKPTYAFTDLTSHPTTLSDYGITDAVKFAGNITTIGSGSPASGAKTWWKNTTNVPKLKIVAAYNNNGTEWSMLFSKGNEDAHYGSILRWGYNSTYIYILRKSNANEDVWQSEDWEKISAGYADSAPWSGISSKPTTLSGYGITDAKIESGVITLSNNTITPIRAITSTDNAIVRFDGTSGQVQDSNIIIDDNTSSIIFVKNNLISTSTPKVGTTTNLTASDSDLEWIKALLKQLCIQYPSKTNTLFKGSLTSDSNGYYEIFIYNTSILNENGLPQYSNGTFKKQDIKFYVVGTQNYVPFCTAISQNGHTHNYAGSSSAGGAANFANAANLTTTANAIAYYTDTAGTFSSKASANGALYATSANGTLNWGTLPVSQGGTGATSFTANSVIISGSTTTSALTTRGIKNITGSANNLQWTNDNTDNTLVTTNTLAYWNGRYNSTSSNLAYYSGGAFGTMAKETAADYAKLASPALTGTPTAPTAANGTNTTQIATTAFVNNTLAYANAMTFKGTLGTGGTITVLPASHNAGDTYRVITAETYAGKYCEVGTLIICIKDGTAAADADWTSVETNEDGSIIGPSNSAVNQIAKFSSATGRVITNSGITIDNSENIAGVNNITTSGIITFSDNTAGNKIAITCANDKVFSFKTTDNATNMDIGYDYLTGAGAGLGLRSADHTYPGQFCLYARNSTDNAYQLVGNTSGILTWSGRRVLTATNNTQIGSATLPVYIDGNGYAQVCTADSTNVNNSLVVRDSSGNFSANTINASNLILTPPSGSWPAMITLKGANNKDFSFKFSNSGLNVDIGWDWSKGDGAGLALRSAEDEYGEFVLYARKDTTAEYRLVGTTFGTLKWNGYRVVTATNSIAIGSDSQPVYINSSGQAVACTSINASITGAWAKPSTVIDGQAIISSGTDGSTVLRSITNNTSAAAVIAGTNLITANTLYYHTGNSNITTVGTITTGTWQGTAIAEAYIGSHSHNYAGSSSAGGAANTIVQKYTSTMTSSADYRILFTENSGTTGTTDVSSSARLSSLLYFNPNTGRLTATSVANAIWNDYAEYRTTLSNVKPGQVVADNDDGSLYITNNRLVPGAQVVSDTWGHIMGETETAKTPIAVAGRVLVYTYQPRENYHAGMAVCSAPNGTVDIMTREEIEKYPDCIIGIVSEIPDYKKWGTNQTDVNNRIWIKIK